MNDIHNDHDYEWTQVDHKSKYLIEQIRLFRSRIEALEIEKINHLSMMKTLEAQDMEHSKMMRNLDRYQALLMLSTLEEITKDQVRTILKMLTSVDEENHLVADEAIKQLLEKLKL